MSMISTSSVGSGSERWLANAIRVPSGDQLGIQLSLGPDVSWTWRVRSGFAVQIWNWSLLSKRMNAMRPFGPGCVALTDPAARTTAPRTIGVARKARRGKDIIVGSSWGEVRRPRDAGAQGLLGGDVSRDADRVDDRLLGLGGAERRDDEHEGVVAHVDEVHAVGVS